MIRMASIIYLFVVFLCGPVHDVALGYLSSADLFLLVPC